MVDAVVVVPAVARAWSSGLEEVVAAATRLSCVDGEAGVLRIAGAFLKDVVGRGFVGVTADLLARAAADDVEAAAADNGFAARYRAERTRLDGISFVDARWLDHEPMTTLRFALCAVDGDDPARFVAATHVVLAAWLRAHGGTSVEANDNDSAGVFLLKRGLGDKDVAAGLALDRYLTTVIDHGMNASTFTARVVASTRASLSSSLTAALGALSGPLHGGAPGPVLDLLDAVAAGGVDVIERELDAGRRLMGFGHRVYRVRDPRAAVLEATVDTLLKMAPPTRRERLQRARSLEATATAALTRRHPDRPLPANVEFFTAVLLEALGLPREAFSAVFAAGRVGGWCAHVVEQRRTGKLIRPKSIEAR